MIGQTLILVRQIMIYMCKMITLLHYIDMQSYIVQCIAECIQCDISLAATIRGNKDVSTNKCNYIKCL